MSITCKLAKKAAALLTSLSVLTSSCAMLNTVTFAESGSANSSETASFALLNIKADEGEYKAFIRLGNEFYLNSISGKYSEASGAISQESVYAFEYALNKDILSEKTVERLTKDGIIDLATYAETVNSFCAEMMEQVYSHREENGITAPDFDELTLNGYDFYNSRTATEYLARHAVLEKNALWEGDHSHHEQDYWECVNSDGQLVFGWVKLPDGSIVLQTGGLFGNVTTDMPDDNLYRIVQCGSRYYFLLHGVLQDSVTINFRAYENSENAEDRDIVIPLDEDCGISISAFEECIGETNTNYLNKTGTVRDYLLNRYNYSLPIARTDEYNQTIELTYSGESELSVDALSCVKLDVSVKGDSTGLFDGDIYFTSSDPSVADVDNEGNVYGISTGDAVISAVARTAGICRPLQVNVHVNSSPAISRNTNIGYSLDDIVWDCENRGSSFDALADKLAADGATSVMIGDRPVFKLDGSNEIVTENVVNGELTLTHEDDSVFTSQIKFSDYKTLADMAHQKGIKVNAFIQPEWNDGSGLYDGCPVSVYFERYAADPTDSEAKQFVDKYFGAYEQYWVEVAPMLKEAGVDGIYLNYCTAFELLINDGHWSQLVSKVEQVYDGEILAMAQALWESQLDPLYDNSDFVGSFDRIGLQLGSIFDEDTVTENPSLADAKQLVENHFSTAAADRLNALSGKPVDISTRISSTAIPLNNPGEDTGKGECYTSWEQAATTHSDYLQQMIMWQAFCEVFSSKNYVDTIISQYNCNYICNPYGMEYRSGYDCSTTVYEKPASKLLERWSVKAPLNDALKYANAALALAGDKYAQAEAEALREAITCGYAATSAEAIVSVSEEIITLAAQLSEKAAQEAASALTAARAELRQTIDGAPTSEGYSVKSYAALTAAVQAAEALLSDEATLYCDIVLAKEDILAAITALVELPECVANVRAIAGDGLVTVKWDKVQDADGYRVLYNDGEWHSIDAGNVESCLIKGLTNGQTYKIAVQYVESSNYSASSAEVTATPEELIPVRLNVKPNEGEYNAFVRLGKEFYENYIEGKYPDEDGSIINLNSVYAFEYALNKDILDDSTIERIVKDKLVDLPTYAETVNSFCAEMIQAIDDQRVQNGVTAPDFDRLTFYGYDLYRSRSASHYLFRHAILEKNATWEADFTDDNYNVCRNAKGDLVFGWVKLPDGNIVLQTASGSQEVGLRYFWISDHYQFIQSNDRFFFIDSNCVLQKDNVTVNFADYVPEGSSWWEQGLVQPEDRDIVFPLDENCSISVDDFEELLGNNIAYFVQGETFHLWYVYFNYDFALTNERTDEYNKTIELSYDGDEMVFLDCLTSTKLNVTVKNDDPDGWYGNNNNMFFTSSDPSVAEVDNLGNVYGISEGDAIITAVARTSGICKPVRIKVHVNNSPEVTRTFDIGYELEDCLYESISRGVMFDSLAERVNKDGCSYIIALESATFYLNGEPDFSDDEVLGGELTLEHIGNYAISIEDYRRLAEDAHKNGTKLYAALQLIWDGAWMNSEEMYAPVMLKRFAADPTNAEAAQFTDQYFNAMKNYWVEIAPQLEEAGVDGIFIHTWQSFEECVMDDHWSDLISAVREVYHGELLAMVSPNHEKFDIYQNNGYIFNNVDKIECFIYNYFLTPEFGFNTKNPSLADCKKVFTEANPGEAYRNQTILDFTQMFYDLYHKPIELKLNISATDQPTGHIYNYAGKGKFVNTYGNYTEENIVSVDYLQQMITLQALLEVISEVEYIEDFSTCYFYSIMVRPDCGYDTSSGYDCSASVYDKPAAQLLAQWSNKAPLDKAIRKAKEALALAGDVYAVTEAVQLRELVDNAYPVQSNEEIAAKADEITQLAAEVRAKAKEESACTECTVTGHSLLLDDGIGLKFYLNIPDSAVKDPTAEVRFTVNGKETIVPVSEAENTADGFAFICPVAAAEMNDTITGQLYVGENALGSEFTCSVKEYADYILEKTEIYSSIVPMVKAMLNYGGAAEKFFRGSSDISVFAPAVTAEELAPYRYILTDNDSKVDFKGQIITLNSKVTAKLYFSGRDFVLSDFTVMQNGKDVDASRIKLGSDSSGTYLAITGISADEMGSTFEVSVGGVSISNYSVYSYVRSAINSGREGLPEVAAALYAYGKAVAL